jgi:hypothetical protein
LEAEDLVGLADRYVRAWNESDFERRRVALVELYTRDGRVVTQSAAFEGIESIVAHVGEVHGEFVGAGRYRFGSGGALSHHGFVLFRWELVDANEGDLADAGMNLFLLADDGRIEADVQFVLGVESSIGHLAVH